jgi:endonuclease III
VDEQPLAARARRTREIADRLAVAYGPRPWRRELPPVDELIATILSQHTSDTNTARAFASLRASFPTWYDVIAASDAEIADAIRSGGLANIKAPRIKAVLAELLERYGCFDLDHLATLTVDAARRELTSIHGIGPKTASCVLLFSLGMPAMPVDTHVHRVTSRVGLLPAGTSAQAAHATLERQLGGGRDDVYAFHMHLIHHGRTVCVARRPLCERCAIQDCCDYVGSTPTHAA